MLRRPSRRSVTMKISAIAKELGTTPRTVRFYEEQGLLHPRRSAKGTRIYDEEDMARFSVLLNFARLGFSIDALSALVGIRSTSQTGDEASHKVASQLQSMDQELEQRARVIEKQREDIQRAQTFLKGCHGCNRQPIRSVCDECTVSAGRKGIDVLQVVWDEQHQ